MFNQQNATLSTEEGSPWEIRLESIFQFFENTNCFFITALIIGFLFILYCWAVTAFGLTFPCDKDRTSNGISRPSSGLSHQRYRYVSRGSRAYLTRA